MIQACHCRLKSRKTYHPQFRNMMDVMKAYKLHKQIFLETFGNLRRTDEDADAANVNNIKAIKSIVLFAY